MAISCGFFNSKGLDRTYTAEDFCDYLGSIICDGVQAPYGDCFALTTSGMTATIGTGKAWIKGHYFISNDKYEIDLIIFAIPSASVQDRKEILDICRETGKRIQSVPGLVQIITGEVNTTRLRDVSTDELLERD